MLLHSMRLRKSLSSIILAGLTLLLSPTAMGAVNGKIEAEDTLTVVVNGEPSLSKDYPVNTKGNIEMDLVGPVKVAGLTPAQAQGQITSQLKKYLKLFTVKVTLAEETAVRVLVFGEVTKPGAVKIGPNGKLLDALAEAGALTANADSKRITVLRKSSGKTETFDLDEITSDRSKNARLSSGDTITIPAQANNSVQINGEVRTAGSRPVNSAKTLYAAIQAAGPTDNADWSRILLRRKGAPEPVTVDLAAVRAGTQKDDVELQAGDQITVVSRIVGGAKILGEVKTPGEKSLTGKTYLLDFIATAGGGFTEKADLMRVEIRRPEGDPVKVDMTAVLRGERNSSDPELEIRPDDVIFVPNGEKNRFTIVGGVNKGGTYLVQPGMTVLDAITMAEGLKGTAVKKFVVAPVDPNDERIKKSQSSEAKKKARGKKEESKTDEARAEEQGLILVDYSKMIGKADGSQNILIKAGDKILVPEEQPSARGPKRSIWDILPFVNLLRGGF